MGQWRWTLIQETEEVMSMESGQSHSLRNAMSDVAITVEYLLEKV